MAIKPTPLKYNLKIISLCFLLFLLSVSLGFQIFFMERAYPVIYIGGVSVGGLTLPQAKQLLEESFKQRAAQKLQFTYQDQVFEIDASQLNLQVGVDSSLEEAFTYGRSKFYYSPVYIDLPLQPNDSLEKAVNKIAQEVNQPAVDAQILIADNQINVTPSQPGLTLDEEALKKEVLNFFSQGKPPQTDLPFKTVSPRLSYEKALEVKRLLDKVKLQPLQLNFGSQSFFLDFPTVFNMVDLSNSHTEVVLNKDKLTIFVSDIATKVDQKVEEPLFSFDGKRVTAFKPPKEGKQLSKDETIKMISNSLLKDYQTPLTLPVETIQPKNKLTNELGIKQLLGQGVSRFSGSIANRIFNINLAASRLNGVLIPPGEVFSFNQTVGDISATSGYKQAYIIKSGRTILDDGGGVCQVSTTLFRAALNAGLPIIARTAHAYRVSYYEQGPAPGGAGQGFPPGLDATVFAPSVDFQFKNDTPAHILIQAYSVGESLYIDFYGTSDGRVVNLSKPVIASQTPPLPELKQDDPTLPKGTIKQVDWPAWGANVSFTRTVTRGGEKVSTETFYSNYRPWQAVYLVGTKE